MEDVERHEVQIVVELGLAGEVAKDVRDAVVGVAHLEAPGGFETAPEIRVVQAGLATEQAEREAEIARLEVREVLRDNPLEHRRIGGRAGDRRDA